MRNTTIKSTLDLAFALLCIGPIVVVYWRGTFNAVSEIMSRDFPTLDSRLKPSLILYLCGMSLKITLDLIKHSIREILRNEGAKQKIFATTIILYLDAIFSVLMWVEGFNFLNEFPILLSWYCLASILVVVSIILMLLKAFHCTGGVPLTIKTDKYDDVFNPTSYFGTKFNDNDISYKLILDTIFTYSIVHTFVIICWWCLWELENRYILYPCEITVKDIQAWDSVIIAFFLVFVVVAICNHGNGGTTEEHAGRKRAVENFLAFLSFIAAVNYWRGIWSLLDFYFFPFLGHWENLILSHIIGFLFSCLVRTTLCLTQSSLKDSKKPEFISCRYFSTDHEVIELKCLSMQPSETSPLLVTQL